MFIMQNPLTVNAAISLFPRMMKERVNASYLAEGPAPPMFSLILEQTAKQLLVLLGAQPAQRCLLYQKLFYAAKSSFRAVTREAVLQDCAYICKALVSTKPGLELLILQ